MDRVKTKHVPNEVNHESVEVNYAGKSRKLSTAGCYYCGKPGHIAAQCYKAKYERQQESFKKNMNRNRRKQTPYHSSRSQSRDSNRNNDYRRESRKSHQKPRFKSSRRKEESSSEESTRESEFAMDIGSLPATYGTDSFLDKCKDKRFKLKTKATINEKVVDVLLDTGAVVSVIPLEIARECKIPIRKSEIQIRTASGRREPIFGITEQAKVNVHGCETKIEFIVIPNSEQPVLLGGDWHVKSGVTTCMKDQKISFGNKVIQIADEDLEDIEAEEALMCGIMEFGEEEEFYEEFFEDQDKSFKDRINLEELGEDKSKVKEQFYKLLDEYKDVFANSLEDLGKPCSLEEHKITTINETPIFQYPYRKSPKENDLIREEVEKILKAKIIRPSTSPWSAPALMITIQDPFPVPRTDDVFDRLALSKVFTTLDLKSGYWQFLVDRESIEKTAFSTNDGHYEFLRMPFGLKNAPARLSRAMRRIFAGVKFVEVYFDDMTIHSNTNEEHVEHLKFVLEKLRQYNLKINASKGEWFKKSVKVLGHIISEKTITMDPEKVNAIEEFKQPSSVNEIQRFLGLCGAYRRFVREFAHIAAPMHKLLKKDSKWNWSQECQTSFEELRKRLVSFPILRHPDFNKEFILYTDASGTAIGAILCQRDNFNNEYVVAYASRKLKGAEINYGITEKECLAVIWGIKHFSVYLQCQKFKVVTDHSALQWLMRIKEPKGKLARWAIFLQTYDFEIIYRQGKKHQNVDAISRSFDTNYLELYITDVEQDPDASQKSLDIHKTLDFYIIFKA
ncbi:unnamed protein product [Brachionus calyciflorus]|uniref:RNA-directed DNA polymerase n=1 Tax=Brachionus calyciflorus TaxID=104777 RepID=A0A813WXK6_9BILA|nr:unnamed protein product [Brachionus calyciflorus]